MYVYKQTERPGWYPSPRQKDSAYLTGSIWTVGYYDPINGVWNPESDHESPDLAAERVANLNGNNRCGGCPLRQNYIREKEKGE